MRRSIATVSLSGTLEEKLRAAAAARFDAVEIFENDLLFFDGSAREVRSFAGDLGLEIALYQPFRDFEGVSDEQLKRNLERAERKFDVMAELGAPLMLVCSNVSPQALDDDARAAAQLRALAERAARRGLRVGYEALAWGTRVNTWQHAWRLVDQAAHPHLGLVLDSFHTLALGGDTAAVAGVAGERIAFVQLADMPRLSMDLLSWSRHFRCFPGQGDFDVAAFLAPILRAGYTGPLSLEVFNDDFRAAPSRPTAVDGMRSLLLLEEQTRALLGEPAPAPAASQRRPRVELFDPPPVPALDGIAFVEVAVDDATRVPLADLLGSLGFRRAGRHRSKEVSLFRQGAIAFVLNAEPDSFAHSYLLMHGPAICALGLATPDPAQALARADAFACTRFAGRVGPEEWPIPAIRALDGSLLYFVAEPESGKGPLETDFIADPADAAGAAADAGLLAVDHIAQALPDGQLESWILFYRAVLGLVPEAPVALNDPYGVVRSRAVSSANRALRFPLNISQSPNTATARSVSTFAGAGVHHIALRAADIFAAARFLEQRGVKLLPIPANYYDDLAARLDLAPELIDELRRHNLLYDRSAAGDYFQLYTEPFADRFFFEIVQRATGYDAYGAANAPVRMAAQASRRGGARADVLGLL